MPQIWNQNREHINRTIDKLLLSLWHPFQQLCIRSGSICIFLTQSSLLILTKPYRWNEIIKHIEFIGNKSLIIIALTGAFTGMALSYQIYMGFSLVNATNLVGPTVALGITRELGPVLTGLIVAARAGGAMAARLGTMRVTEQIDALEVMGINPIQYLVAPRIIAAFISMPLLCGVFDSVALLGSHALCVHVLSLDEAIFWDKIQSWLSPSDVGEGLVKSAFFGLIFTAICTNRGFNTKGGAKGVGEATNQGVVNSMVLIIIINFFMTNLFRLTSQLLGEI